MDSTKNMAQSMPIAGNEYVAELMNLLEANNMPGAKDLLAAINQISAMEKQYSNILTQLSVMREELAEAQRQNHPIKTALQKAVIALQAQVLDLRDRLDELKGNFIDGCKNALEAFQEKGLSALRNLADFFKLRPGLEALRGDLDKSIKLDERTIAAIEAVSVKYHEAGRHLQNAGRAIAGKELIQEAKPVGKIAKAFTAATRADRACLMAIRGSVDKAIGAVARLEKTERKPPIMETIENLGKQVKEAERAAPVRDRQRPAPVHADR